MTSRRKLDLNELLVEFFAVLSANEGNGELPTKPFDFLGSGAE